VENDSELYECRMYYRSAACDLAADAAKLAVLLTDGSADLIECQFAQVRASYAKCKGAHAAMRSESMDLSHLRNSLASSEAESRKRMTEDLMAMI
jgi:hypothetical protein